MPRRVGPAVRRWREGFEYHVVSMPLLAVNLLYRQNRAGPTGSAPTARATAVAQLR